MNVPARIVVDRWSGALYVECGLKFVVRIMALVCVLRMKNLILTFLNVLCIIYEYFEKS